MQDYEQYAQEYAERHAFTRESLWQQLPDGTWDSGPWGQLGVDLFAELSSLETPELGYIVSTFEMTAEPLDKHRLFAWAKQTIGTADGYRQHLLTLAQFCVGEAMGHLFPQPETKE